MAQNNFEALGHLPDDCNFKEAVCINAGRIYDSCSDKDCLEDLRIRFTDSAQPIIDNSYSVKARSCETLNVIVDVEPVPFNKGFYSVDMTYFFLVGLDAYTSPVSAPIVVSGIATCSKKVILYGSCGGVKIFTNDQNNTEAFPVKALPKANVQVAEPMILSCKLVECPDDDYDDCYIIPNSVAKCLEGAFEGVTADKAVEVSIGLFTIVQLERQVQMLIPCYDFCIPEKECTTSADDPCSLFEKIDFPVDEFFPPRASDLDEDNDCGC